MPKGIYIRTKPVSEITRQKLSKSLEGNDNSKGIIRSKEIILKISVGCTGKSKSKNHCIHISEGKRGKRMGKLSSNWKGGKKLRVARSAAKRKRHLGFIPLNNCEVDGWVGHHIDKNYVIFIPEELHHSVWHSVIKDINMNTINDKVYEWFIYYYLKEYL